MSYISSLLNHSSLKDIVDYLIERIEPHTDAFQAVAVSGYSQTIIGSIVAHRLNKNLIVVRKNLTFQESSHSPALVEDNVYDDYIIVDDFIDTGRTFAYIQSHIYGKMIGYCLWRCERIGPFYNLQHIQEINQYSHILDGAICFGERM